VEWGKFLILDTGIKRDVLEMLKYNGPKANRVLKYIKLKINRE
jgi:hypothetical protein